MINEKGTRDIANFGLNLYKARTEKNITREELAAMLFLSSARIIYAYENGEKFPSVQTLVLISKALDVTMDSLFL